MKKTIGLTLISLAAVSGCGINTYLQSNTAADVTASYNSINKEQLIEHIKVLSSDEFEGRAPSSKGEELTLDYLTKQLTAVGFKPGNGESFLQAVPMVSIEASPDMTLSIGDKNYQYGHDMVMGSSRISDLEQLKDSELVFVGYGINAPEYNWNDYKDLDVKGKTVVILVNDPGFATQDPALFNGNAMTYYGRWTYKYEEASRQGAEGAIIIHETAPASYNWSVVEHSWTGPQFGFVRDDLNKGRVAVEGWVNRDGLFNFSDRTRKPQMALAEQFGFTDYAQPAGGCCFLTDAQYSVKLADLWKSRGEKTYEMDDIMLLKVGRHLRPKAHFKVIISREEGEGNFLKGYKNQYDSLKTSSHAGPLALIDGELEEDDILLAARLVSRFSQGRDEPEVALEWRKKSGESQELKVAPLQGHEIPKEWYI